MMKKLFSGDLVILGSFELTGPVMRISDPCYDREVWCCGTVDNCRVGTWEAAVLKMDEGDWGVRNAVLAVRYKDGGPKFNAINRAVCNGTGAWHECPFEVGVDSGQAGFFDELHYQDNSVVEKMNGPEHDFGDAWYSHCCDITITRTGAGVMPYGAVSSSGYGDGGYAAIKHLDRNGKIDFIFGVFIDNEDEEEVP
jgi:hypothetical protein